jgi:predicted RNA-binding protein YlqC (UPF0109 family)
MSEDIKGLEIKSALDNIITNIVSDSNFSVDFSLDGETRCFNVKAPKSELGKIIGKSGDMASSIRKVVRAMGKKRGVSIKFSIDNRPM